MRWIDVRVAGWENSYLTNSPSSSELLPLPQLLSPLRSRVEEWHLSDSCEQEVEVQNTNSLLKGSSPHSSGWAAISDWNPPGPAGPLVLLIASPSLSYNAFASQAPQCGHEAGLEAAACSGFCCWHQSPSFTQSFPRDHSAAPCLCPKNHSIWRAWKGLLEIPQHDPLSKQLPAVGCTGCLGLLEHPCVTEQLHSNECSTFGEHFLHI